MNGFKKNKNGTFKRSSQPDVHDDQLGENASEEFKPEEYRNANKTVKKDK